MKTKPGAQADEVDTSPAKGPASETVEELRKVRRQVQDLQQQISKNSESDQKTEDWIHIGYVIDRFLFILYGIFISVSFIAIVIIWIHSNSY